MSYIRPDIDNEEVRFMYEVEGMTRQAIADYYGVCQMTICNRLNPDNKKERNERSKQWYIENSEYSKEYCKEYYQEHSEEIKEYKKQWRLEHPEEKKERNKQWRLEHPGYDKDWRVVNPDKAQEKDRKMNAKRRDLGSIELNNPFDDSEGHHIDENYIIHIPKELHRSIYHNLKTGEGMEEINEVAFRYITEEVFDKLIAGEM